MIMQITSSLEHASASRDKEIIEKLKKLQDTTIKVGFFSGSNYPDGTPIAAVAKWNNDGTNHIPERPFFTKGILVGRLRAKEVFKEGFPDYMSGDVSLKAFQSMIGETYQDTIVEMIDSDMPPPNAPSTWERKFRKGLNVRGRKLYHTLKGKDYQKALEAMNEKYTTKKGKEKMKYRTGSVGTPRTLIDTGAMRDAVTYRIVNGE